MKVAVRFAAASLVLATVTAVRTETPTAVVGFSENPPLGYVGPDGKAAGFAVEVLNEAARRDGIRLTWRLSPEGADEALASKAIDIWPAGADLPRRRNVFHLTSAWWHSEMQLLVRADNTGTESRRIGHLEGLGPEMVHDLPLAIPIPFPTYAGAVSEVCGGTMDGVILDRSSLERLLLNRPAGCASTVFRVLPLRHPRLDLSIAARTEYARMSERLRRRIDEMGHDGSLAAIAVRYPTAASASAAQLVTALRGRYRQNLLGFGLLSVCLLLAGSFLMIHRLRRDIAAQKLIRAELERSEDRLARAHSIASLGWWETDLETGATEWSGNVRGMLGIEAGGPEQLLAGIDAPERDQVAAALNGTIATGQPFCAECWVNAPGGRRFVRHHAEAVRGRDGRLLRLVGTVQDLTGHKQLQDQLLQSQKLESIGRLAGGVAHDFNNLLTVINGYTEVLLAETDESHPMRPALVEIGKAGERATGLATQLLAFSRKRPVQAAPLCLNSVVTDAARMLRRLLGENVEIVTELEPNLRIVKADPGLMQQVLVNLVVNARDAMPDGGRVVIATANVVNRPGPGGGAGPAVALTVADSGCGMDPATQSHIFEPFFTTKPSGRGTGLGLATVYGIVKQSGGWISVDSAVNQGTSFRIFLPQMHET